MVPEEDQPDGYTNTTLTIDSPTATYSSRSRVYLDSECLNDDPDVFGLASSGEFRIEGLTITASGLEATVIRYFSDVGVQELVGLLYRDGDILFRDLRQSTLIEDIVPTQLALNSPLRLVN